MFPLLRKVPRRGFADGNFCNAGLPRRMVLATVPGIGGCPGCFAVEIKPMLLPVCGPALLDLLHFLHGHDSEPAEREDHGADGNVDFRGGTDVAAVQAPENRMLDAPLSADPVQHQVEIGGQTDPFVSSSQCP